MNKKPTVPGWITAYGADSGWCPTWNRAVFERIVSARGPIVDLFERLAATRDDHFQLELLEACLSLPSHWDQLPKTTARQSEQAAETAASKARELADWLEDHAEELRGWKRWEPPEQSASDMVIQLRRLASNFGTEARYVDDPELALRPSHPMAFRNFVVEQLLLLFERAGATCTHLEILLLTAAVTGSVDEADESTVRKARNRLKKKALN